jgi:hypothetical protein
MLRLLEHTPATQSAIPTSRLQVMLNTYQQDWLTGVVRIAWAADARALLLFVDGTITNTYLLTGETCADIPSADLPAHISTETLTVRSHTLPREGVRVVESLLEWYPPADVVSIEAGAVEGQLSAWGAQAATGLIHLTWPDAEGLVILPGNMPPDQGIFMTDRQIESGTAALTAIYNHRGGPCTLARYTAPAGVTALHGEMTLLQTTFDSLVNTLVQRYTKLVGSHMARTLILDLNARAHASGWNVRITSTGVEAQAFDGLESAAQAYRSLLNDLIEHIAVVIGKRLAGVLVLESSIQLGSAAQKAIQTHALIPAITIRRDLYGRNL